jgi:hypothetical protein
MVRSIKVSPKHVLFSTCLLLVLVAGIMAHTAAQSTNLSLGLTVYGLTGPFGQGEVYGQCYGQQCVYFDTVVNGKEYCLYGPQTGYPPTISVELLDGYEGPCDLPLGYVGAGGGGLATSGYHPSSGFTVTGTITVDLTGVTVPYAFTLLVDLTAGGINIQSEVTGNLGTGCTLSNLVSQYAFVRGAGLSLDLQLLATTGTCNQGFLDLTLTFGSAAVAVGGVVIPVSTLAVLAPWLAIIGLVGCIGTVVVFARKRRSQALTTTRPHE